MLGRVLTRAAFPRGHHHARHAWTQRGFHDAPSATPDLAYILDPANREEIAANVARRKGVGDIDAVHAMAKQLETDPENADLRARLTREALLLPNKTHEQSSALGEDPKVIKETFWRPVEFGSMPQTTARPAEKLIRSLLGARVENLNHFSGDKSYYLMGPLAELEQALIHYTVDRLTHEFGFDLVSVPDLLPAWVVERCGMAVEGPRTQVYKLDETDKDGDDAFVLSGTAEMALAALHANKVVDTAGGVRRLAAVSRCYRAETSMAAAERSIYRVHHFTKVEMFAVVPPGCGVSSGDVLEEFLDVQNLLFGDLGLSFRVLDMPPHELGAPANRKFDIEALFPSREEEGAAIDERYGEISSCSDCTDFQSRRLNIRDEEDRFAWTVNGTACAVPRMIMALCEQMQTFSAQVFVPEPLRPYLRGEPQLLVTRPKNERLNQRFVPSPRAFVGKTIRHQKTEEEKAAKSKTSQIVK